MRSRRIRPHTTPAVTRAAAAALAAALALTAASCTTALERDEAALHVVASSELSDLEPLLAGLSEATGVRIDLEYMGTLEATRVVLEQPDRYDAAWLASDAYFQLRSGDWPEDRPLPLREPIMSTPVVLGLRPEAADALRRTAPDPDHLSWADVADQAAAGTLSYGMADPARSFSGLAAMVGVATAAAGTGTALRADDVACNRLGGFLAGRTLEAPDSRRLADAYRADPAAADGLIGYESVLLGLNEQLAEPLEIIQPQDGIVMADYPLMLLDPRRRTAFDAVVGHLTAPRTQRELMTTTLRRPVDPEVPRLDVLRGELGNALYFPGDPGVVDQLVAAARDAGPGTTVLALDFSRSMRGGRIAELRATLGGLAGQDRSATGRFVRFYRGETVVVLRFGRGVLERREFAVDDAASLAGIEAFAAADEFDGGTAVWSALEEAYAVASDAVAAGDGPVTVVLMTDGENNSGTTPEAFTRRYEALPAEVRAVPAYTIRYGDADPAELTRIADLTGGRMLDAGPGTDDGALLQAFQETRGCGAG
ncbi:vWA domain-containing protein [Myceligenerans crystallogenes]|uniref:Substrate-binding domain-containing protein n=1 Tax=Myceligenerans crystallogenes TaxID=316335 RepID=A0ABN2N6M3_9MICO